MAIPSLGYDYEADAKADNVLHYWPLNDKYDPSVCVDLLGGVNDQPINLVPYNDPAGNTLITAGGSWPPHRDLTANGTGTSHAVLAHNGSPTIFTQYYSWTFAMWFRPNVAVTHANAPYLVNLTNGQGFSVKFDTPGAVDSIVASFTDGALSDISAASDPTLTDHLLVVMADSATTTTSVYLDNVLVGSDASAAQALQMYNPSWVIGDLNTVASSTNYFDGTVDEIMVFLGALDGTDRSTLWNTGNGFTSGGLIRYANNERVLHTENAGFDADVSIVYDAVAGDTLGTGDAQLAILRMIAPASEDMSFDDTRTIILRGVPVTDEIIGNSGAFSENLRVGKSVSENLGFITGFNVSGEEYVGVVMNTQNQAVTEYDAVPYNSMTQTDETTYLAASGDGIYEMTGDLDDTAAIDAYITTKLFNFGENHFKRVERAYLGMRNDGPMVMKVITRNSIGDLVEDWYELENTSDTIRTDRVKIGKGLKSHYWQFTLSNKTGADFDLSEIEFMPIKLSRRV